MARNVVGIWAFALATAWVPLVPSGATLGRWWIAGIGPLALLFFTSVRMTWAHWVGVALLCWMALGFAWSPSGWDTSGELIQWACAACALCLAAELKSLDQFWSGLCAGVAASLPFALLQWAGFDPVTSVYFEPTGLFLSKNMMADAAVLAMIGAAFTSPWLVPAPALLVYLTHSRTSVLALAAVAFFVLWLARPQNRRALALAALGTVVVLCAAAFGGMLGQVSDRFEIWSLVVRNLHFAGDGLGSFAIAAPGLEYSHNEFLQYAFELGIGSILLWTLALAGLVPDGPPRERAALVGLLVICGLWFPLHAPLPLTVGAVCAGHLVGRRAHARAVQRSRRMARSHRVRILAPWGRRTVRPLGSLGLQVLRCGGADIPGARRGIELVSVRQAIEVGAGAIRRPLRGCFPCS